MYTVAELAYLTGIPISRVASLCTLLVKEGYLVLDESSGEYDLSSESNVRDRLKSLRSDLKKPGLASEIRAKIEDILALGAPLALFSRRRGETINIGVPGLNMILHCIEPEQDSRANAGEEGGGQGDSDPITRKKRAYASGLPRGHCLLIKGAPGTGKTTLGLQVAIHLADQRARFLTFEEDVDQLEGDMYPYLQRERKPGSERWEVGRGSPTAHSSGNGPESMGKPVGWSRSALRRVVRPLRKIRAPSAWENPELVIEELTSLLDRELPELIVVDSISRFRDLADELRARQVLRRFIRILKARRITALFLGEKRGEDNTFEDYEVDGILELSWVGDIIYLTVNKLRGRRSYRGPHSVRLLSLDEIVELPDYLTTRELTKKQKKEAEQRGDTGWPEEPTPVLTIGVNVFPEISVFTESLGIGAKWKKS